MAGLGSGWAARFATAMGQGHLRVYLGAAPGVGKTYAMLGEGVRRHDRGTDVVVGLVETHGRASTAAQIGDLEIVRRRVVEHRGVRLEEMDVDAVLARRPRVALVDELAHTNAPGSRDASRGGGRDRAPGGLVVNLLDLSRLEAGALPARLDWCDPQELMVGALAAAEPVLDAAEVALGTGMFAPFASASAGAGTGVALALARGLAEAQGATLRWDRAAPGTRFVLSLPLSPAPVVR